MENEGATIAVADEERVFRWLNFGSCIMRVAFDTPKFTELPYQGLPVKISKIWRREISSVVNDWGTARSFSAPIEPSLFSESWVSDIEVFRSADVILVDLVLDIFQDSHLRFRRPGEAAGVSYNGVVSNFPEEPPDTLEADLCVYECNPEQSLRAWELFGQEISTPTVFITYENRDDISVGYPEVFRRKLLDYQDAVFKLSKSFTHWLVISMDDIFEEFGACCYIDRHHPSEIGWDVLRDTVPKLISASGILRENAGGPPLSASTKYIPERADFIVIDPGYLKRLKLLNGGAVVVGPKRLTNFARDAFGETPLSVLPSFSQLQQQASPGLIIVMKWDQPPALPGWLSGLMKQHPESIIELPCLWRGRENSLFRDKEETALRRNIKGFAKANQLHTIVLPAISTFHKRYLARLLLSTHKNDACDDSNMVPITSVNGVSASVILPQNLLDTLVATTLTPVFGAHS